MAGQFWNKKSFVLITGASRGLGRQLSIEFAKKVSPDSVFLLLARNSTTLEETRNLIHKVAPSITVKMAAIDLSCPNKEAYFNVINSEVGNPNEFEHSILVHNAASIGNLTKYVSQLDDLAEMEEYYRFNVVSMILLTSQFVKVFSDSKKQRSVIQITSGLANFPLKTMGYYCSGKAARDMLIRTLAIEEPTINTLSYSPGMFVSDMNIAATKDVGDPDVKKLFTEAKETGQVGTAENSAKKLVRILEEKWYMGEHIDIENIPD